MIYDVDDYNALRVALHNMCAAFVSDQISQETVFNCKFVANELLSNALQYGGGARFCVEILGNSIKISVKSANGFRPPEVSVCSGEDETRGRGLFLVDAISECRLFSEEEGICVFIKIK